MHFHSSSLIFLINILICPTCLCLFSFVVWCRSFVEQTQFNRSSPDRTLSNSFQHKYLFFIGSCLSLNRTNLMLLSFGFLCWSSQRPNRRRRYGRAMCFAKMESLYLEIFSSMAKRNWTWKRYCLYGISRCTFLKPPPTDQIFVISFTQSFLYFFFEKLCVFVDVA